MNADRNIRRSPRLTRRAAVIKLEIVAAIGSRGGTGEKRRDGRGNQREASPPWGEWGIFMYWRKIDRETCMIYFCFIFVCLPATRREIRDALSSLLAIGLFAPERDFCLRTLGLPIVVGLPCQPGSIN